MALPAIKPNFASGELSPSLYGRVDLAKWHSGCSVARNFFVSYKGGLLSRGGLGFVGICKQPANANSVPPRNIEFTFNIFQSYILEFGEQYMRVVANGGYVLEAAFAVTVVTQANPAVLTAPGNNFANGDWIFIENVGGMTELNIETYIVQNVGIAGSGTFTITDLFGDVVQSQNFNAYTSGGTVARLYTLVTPYHAVDLPYLKYTQSADVMSLTCVNQQTLVEYPPQELSRLAANSWQIAPPVFASSINPPNACTVTGTAYSSGSYGPVAYGYVVTAVDAVTGDESQASPIGVATGIVDISAVFGTNTVTWPSVPGASYYNVYKTTPDYTNTGEFAGQIFGFVGFTYSTSWQDTNVIADFTTTPPLHLNPFAGGQVLNIAMQAGGGSYSIPDTTVSISSATGSGFSGTPIISGQGINGQTLTFSTANTFSVGNVLTQLFGTNTATGTVLSTGTNYVNISLSGATQFVPTSGFEGYVFSGSNTAFVTSVAPYTNSGTGSIVGVYIYNYGQNYQSTDSVVFTDSSHAGSGAIGTIQVGPQDGNFPGVVTYFQQRRDYGYSINQPDTYELSQPGSYLNFDSATPPIDSDAITGTPWAQQINGIQWMLPMPGGLVTFTGETTWQVAGTGGVGTPITPSQQSAVAQEAIGCSPTLPPLRIRYNLLFGDSFTAIINEVNYNFFFNIYTGQDITVLSAHLFNNYELVQWGWSFNPYRVVWGVRNDGKILSLTYVQEQEVRGWARHDTNGLAVSVAIASEPPANAPYFIVKRYVLGKGVWVYMQERMDNRLWQNVEESFCLDSALSYPQPAPNANLTASAAQGIGGVKLGQIILGGSDYSVTPAGVVVDDAGTGQGAAVTSFTVMAGAITDLTITPGIGYGAPRLVVTDATGSGAVVSLVVDNSVTFTADSGVFDGVDTGVPGQVIRMGGGIGTVSSYVSPTQIIAQVPPQSAITVTVPNDPNVMPVPAASGTWTITTPVGSVSGLSHLEGMAVNALCDGTPVLGLMVENGMVTLPNPASQILVGLPFIAQSQSMHAELPGEMIQGDRKRIAGVTVRLANSRGIYVGQDQPVAAQQRNQQELPWNVKPNFMTQLTEVQALAGAGNAIPLFSGDKYVLTAGDYQTTDGQPSPGMVGVLQVLPLPCEILAFIPQLVLGDQPRAN